MDTSYTHKQAKGSIARVTMAKKLLKMNSKSDKKIVNLVTGDEIWVPKEKRY